MKTLVKMYATIGDDYKEEQKVFYVPLSVVLEYLEGDDLTEFMEEYTTDDTNALEALSVLRGYDHTGDSMENLEFAEFWALLGDEPTIIDKDTQETVLEKHFAEWEAGTPIEEIWGDVSRHYNKPLLEMLYGTE